MSCIVPYFYPLPLVSLISLLFIFLRVKDLYVGASSSILCSPVYMHCLFIAHHHQRQRFTVGDRGLKSLPSPWQQNMFSNNLRKSLLQSIIVYTHISPLYHRHGNSTESSTLSVVPSCSMRIMLAQEQPQHHLQ